MLFFVQLRLLLRRLGKLRMWLLPVGVILSIFITSWPLMMLAEGVDAKIVQPQNFWWWFLVTATTIGYGDFFPSSGAGHVVGAYVIVGGIVTLTMLFSRIVTSVESARGRRTRGAITVTVSDHIVILGYAAGRTERIIEELQADGDVPIVLAAWSEVDTHPMPEHNVEFVRGNLIQIEVLIRTGITQAQAVLVDARDDNEALALALAVAYAAPEVRIVVALRDLARSTQMSYINTPIQCVPWHSLHMITEELQSPGINEVYSELMTHGGENTYSAHLPLATSYGRCQAALGFKFGATLLGVRTDRGLFVSPPWTMLLPKGATLYYVSRFRIPIDKIADVVHEHHGTLYYPQGS